jgi:Phage Mu protein F like protein
VGILEAKAVPISSQTKEELAAVLADESAVIRRAFIAFVKILRSDVLVTHIIRRFRARDLAGAIAVIRDEVAEFSMVFGKVFNRIANEEVKRINRSIQQERKAKPKTLGETKVFRVSFEPGNPEAAKELRKIGLQFIRQFTADQRRLVRRVLSESLKSGEGPLAAARKLKESIGLTDYQQQVVENYRTSLETGSRDALDRVLRDARFDSTVTRAVDSGNILPRPQIERMVRRYAERMIDYRARTIARTEAMRAVSRARHTAWSIAVRQLGGSHFHVHKTWIATLDDRVRDSHADMDHQRVTGMDTPFESGDGELLLYPGDPLAPAEEVINCRCSVLYNLPI